ncbi:MAG: alanine--glyoxylate aminotransferase family protein [Myxococcota bacterium]
MDHLDPPARVLLGPGPSDVPSRVLRALAAPTVGHLDPYYLEVMEDVRSRLRACFRTDNGLTFPISATGMAGMEACLANLLEAGDEMLVVVNGVFGGRMVEVAGRLGATVHALEVPWGETVDADALRAALEDHPKVACVGLVHAETSTGAHQPLEGLGELVHAHDALFVVDAVTSFTGVPLEVDAWGIDACYTGSQKCLSAPPGLSPVTFSPRAVARMEARRTPVQSWYLDTSLLRAYWEGEGGRRSYHHTAPVNMTYALREALQMVMEEGLEARFARHRAQHLALRAGLEALGLSYVPSRSLPMLNCVRVPEGLDEAAARRRLLDDWGLEIGGGLGPFAGRAWRVGLMGASCTRRHVDLALTALASVLGRRAHEALDAAEAAR